MQDAIYNAAKASLGKHLTLDPSVPFDVGCAEAVSTVLLSAGVNGIPQRGFAGTWDLFQWLSTNKQFIQSVGPEYGGVIISPTDPKAPQNHGHTGIILQHGIGSNSSATGLFNENYTYAGWVTSFQARGLPTYYFSPRCG